LFPQRREAVISGERVAAFSDVSPAWSIDSYFLADLAKREASLGARERERKEELGDTRRREEGRGRRSVSIEKVYSRARRE